jgi:predicted DsbA family dithiol-disulfide isomerase
VGKKRLEKGIALYKENHPDSNDTFSLTWKPFYLNPDAPKTGVDKQGYYVQKFGPQRFYMMNQRITQIGREYGIEFKFGGKLGNTRDSHRLIQLAKTKSPEMQTRVIEQLFTAYFEQEQDITDHTVLSKAAVAAGLDETEVKDWLASDRGGPEVDKEVLEAKKNFISGVPNYTVQDKYQIEGAEDPSAFVQIFERIRIEQNGH